MKIDTSVSETLEIEKVLDLFGACCRSELGLWELYRISPATDLERLRQRQQLFREFVRFRDSLGDLPWYDKLRVIDDLLDNARENMILSGEELLHFRNLLALAGRIRETILEVRDSFPLMARLARGIRLFDEELRALGVLADDGRLYDSASPELADLRETMGGLRRSIREKGQALLNDSSIRSMLQERVLSLRRGRFLVLVKQEHLNVFPGVVSDRSGSGNTLYMEPHTLVPLNNKLALLTKEEQDEERRILRELTLLMLDREKALREVQKSVGTIDLLYAEATVLQQGEWVLPELSERSYFSLRKVRHPILAEKAIPIDISCGDSSRLLVITGPNTGGKTVALKTCGVAVLLAWLGFPVPAEEGSVIGNFSSILLDIGDEQSIEQNLSTFSGHIRNIIDILDRADEGSMILLDELGAGTDPQEGAALGVAVLDRLREQGGLVLATTHHNPIKRYALRTPQVETASVEFNVKTLSPTYRLLTGIPGKSNALLIAGRLGMSRKVLDRASAELNGEEGAMEDLIGELQQKRSLLEQTREELMREKTEVVRLKRSYSEKIDNVEVRREQMIQDAEKRAEIILSEAEGRAREMLRGLEGAAESAAQREMGRQKVEIDQIRKRAEGRKRRRSERRKPVVVEEKPFQSGDHVEIVDSGVKGTISIVSGKKATVQAGPMTIEVALKKLRRREPLKNPKEQNNVRINVARPVGIPSSMMVRGMRVDEAMPIVERYLDQAYRAGYSEVIVIHGRGEGILRREVHALCRRVPFVSEFRLGGASEGGHGVTVVTFNR